MKILIAENDPYTQKILQSILAQKGYTVHFSPDGRAGFLSAKQIVPDLILLDVPLSDTDGVQFLQKLRADPEIESIPVIILIAKSQADTKDKYMRVGANACLDKPFHPRQLVAKIESLHL
ncbi:MAG: response regulator [Candidatus Electryonea clarkiae]|nr:response regulator [Candidatus Electryonea clarkiae]